jgi:hypothetical protein
MTPVFEQAKTFRTLDRVATARWLIIDVNSVLGLFHCVVVGDIAWVS